MKDLRELITSEQRSLIESYIEAYAVGDGNGNGSVHYGRRASLDYVLEPWAQAKGMSALGLMFQDSLIVSENIQFHTPENEIYEALDRDDRIRAFEIEYRNWIYGFESEYAAKNGYDTWHKIGNALWELIANRTLVENVYKGDTVSIPVPGEGHDIVIAKGCKPVKMLGKLNAAFHISEKFEAYRIAVSMALNTKIIKGNLCISIHPMDFMTMSDNDCDWDSCMSWRNCGSYRQGTVEMMNSPYIVVAYLAASQPMSIFGQEWSNKKWRSLYIVHPEFIGNVKGYPYQIPEVDKIVINKLKDMMAAVGFGAKFGQVTEYEYGEFPAENDRSVKLDFHTGYMYNDFGSITHYGCVREDEKAADRVTIDYSGRPECMWCGGTYDEDSEENLACDYCYEETRCDCCGDRYHESSLYETGNGEWVCENCLAEYYNKSFRDDEYYRTDDMVRVTVVPDQYKEAIEQGDIDPNKFDWDAPYILDHMMSSLDPNDKWGLKQFSKFLNEGAEVHFGKRDGWYGSRYVPYVFYSELTADTRDDFDGHYGYCVNMLGAKFIRQWKYLDWYFVDPDSETAKEWIKTLDEENAD